MKLLAAVEAMVEAGASPELILAVVRRYETEREVGAMRRREQDADRKRAQRERERHAESRGQAVTERDSAGPSPHVGEPTQVVTPSLPSLRSEEGKNPSTHPSGASPKPKSTRSRKAPEGWEPPAPLMASLNAEGFMAGEIERELAKFRDHEFRDPKSDWPGAFRNWCRRSREITPNGQRPNPNSSTRTDRLGRSLAGLMAAVDEREPVVVGRDPGPGGGRGH